MKICIINNLYEPYNKGGAEKIVKMMAREFYSAGHEIIIISTSPTIAPSEKHYELSYHENLKLYYVKSRYYNLNKIPVFFRLFWHVWDMFDLFTARVIQKVLEDEQPNLVITNNLKGISYLLPRMINKLKIKHIHILHDLQLLYPSGTLLYGQENKMDSGPARIYAFICRYLFFKIQITISPSNWLMDQHKKKNFFKFSQLKIINAPFNVETNIDNKNIQSQREDFIFLFVGQVEKHKGVLFLIEHFNKLSEVTKNIKLFIVGEGLAVAEAKAIAKNNVIFVNQLDSKKVFDQMKNSDCLIVPSLCYENSPTVIYEAISLNLPVIASRIGGITELIHNYGGILFEPGNGQELTDKMRWVIKNYPKIKKRYYDEYQIMLNENRSEYAQKLLSL